MNHYLYVTPFFPMLTSWRGAYCYDFVKALKRELEVEKLGGGGQWNVLVFKEGDGRDYEIGGIKVCTFRARRLPSNVFPNLFAHSNQKVFLSAVERAGIKLEDVAVCHGNTANYGIYPLAVKKVNPKCKALLHHHDLASFGLNMGRLRHCWLYNLIEFPILRRVHEKIDTHVFISEASRRSFLAAPDAGWTQFEDYKKQMRGVPYRPARIRNSIVLHNGVDMSIFHPATQPRSLTSTFIIGCIGNFIDLKGQITLLEAVKILNSGSGAQRSVRPTIRVVFVGSGPMLDDCRRFARENEIKAEFRTEVRHEELAGFYHSLDLFVLPSWFEGFGCVYTEAHSCGIPFIACEGQGIEDLIAAEDRHLWLCKPRDPVDLAAKIKYYIQNRPQQRLTGPIDINELAKEFFKKINE